MKQRSLHRANSVVDTSTDAAALAAASWESVAHDIKLGSLDRPGHPIGVPIVASMLGDAVLVSWEGAGQGWHIDRHLPDSQCKSVFETGGFDVRERHKATGATTIMVS